MYKFSAVYFYQCIFSNVFIAVCFQQCIFSNVFIAVYFQQCIFSIVFLSVYFQQCIFISLFLAVYFQQCIISSVFLAVYFQQCILAVHFQQCIFNSVFLTVYFQQCTFSSVFLAVYFQQFVCNGVYLAFEKQSPIVLQFCLSTVLGLFPVANCFQWTLLTKVRRLLHFLYYFIIKFQIYSYIPCETFLYYLKKTATYEQAQYNRRSTNVRFLLHKECFLLYTISTKIM